MSESGTDRIPHHKNFDDDDFERLCFVELAKHRAHIDKLREWKLTLNQLSRLAESLNDIAERHNSRRRGIDLRDLDAQDHLLSVSPDDDTKLKDAFQFLEEGFHRKEAVMMITDKMTRDEILDRISRDFHIDARELESKGDITVKGVKQWYFPDGSLRIDRIVANCIAITNLMTSRGKPGLRVFGDASPFFKNGFIRELIEYEEALDVKFIGIPLTALCGYIDEDIERLSPSQMERLQKHHKVLC